MYIIYNIYNIIYIYIYIYIYIEINNKRPTFVGETECVYSELTSSSLPTDRATDAPLTRPVLRDAPASSSPRALRLAQKKTVQETNTRK